MKAEEDAQAAAEKPADEVPVEEAPAEEAPPAPDEGKVD